MRKLYCEDCGWRPETVEETRRLHEHHVTTEETVTVCATCHGKRHGYTGASGGGYVSRTGKPVKSEFVKLRLSADEKERIEKVAHDNGMSVSAFLRLAAEKLIETTRTPVRVVHAPAIRTTPPRPPGSARTMLNDGKHDVQTDFK